MIFNFIRSTIFVMAMSALAAMRTIYRVSLLAGVSCRREPELRGPADSVAVNVKKFRQILVTSCCNKRDAVAKRNEADEQEAKADHHVQALQMC